MKAIFRSPRTASPVYGDVAPPSCPQDGVLIKVQAALVDDGSLLRSAHQPIGGSQCAGIVVEVGPDAGAVPLGSRVVALVAGGAQAELAAAAVGEICFIPGSLTSVDACTVPVCWAAASDSLFEFGRLEQGSSVLVDLEPSDFSTAVVQLARSSGAKVFATAGSKQCGDFLAGMGADVVINLAERDIQAELYRQTGGRGVNVAVLRRDMSNLERLIGTLSYRGRAVTVGGVSSQFGNVSLPKLCHHNRQLQGMTFEVTLERERPRISRLIASLLERIANGELRLIPPEHLPMSDAADAFRLLSSGESGAAIVLTT